jgi:S-adenosylmethionine:tRNA ribosyltransferase-isomerase
VDALITNFHQPRSTLLPLVAAFWNREGVRDLYSACLKRGYRFLSYGDACFFQ